MKFKLEDVNEFRRRAMNWAETLEISMMLDGNGFLNPYGVFPAILAAGKIEELKEKAGNGFDTLKRISSSGSYWFGYFSYDLKNETEKLTSNNPDLLNFPDLHFFRPEHLLFFLPDSVIIYSSEPGEVFKLINSFTTVKSSDQAVIHLQHNCSKENYIETVHKIKSFIEEGDVYELNYCLNFSANTSISNPYGLFERLIQKSPAPFSFIFNSITHSIISASPERFLKKAGKKIISQPMKGTSRRGKNESEDELNKLRLCESEKERAENLMIVDLVRNDLARSCCSGSVQVEELFGIYSFPTVHQMISTVTGEVKPGVENHQIIKNAFPMGSMTGAPKIRAMEIIESCENFKRGAFSGAAGYFTPEGDFDLNVIIRSAFINKQQNIMAVSAGSAITFDANPEQEYEECILKMSYIINTLFEAKD